MKHACALLLALFVLSAACAVAQERSDAPKGEDKAPFENLIKQMLDTMDSLSAKLATIHDEETAKLAQPDLRKTASQWQLIKKNAERLPPPTKEEKDRLAKQYKTKLEQAQKKLFNEVARVGALPGGRAALLEISAVLDKKAKK